MNKRNSDMVSHTIQITRDGKIIRYWDLRQIRHNKDAMIIQVGDIIVFEEITFRVTYLGNSKHDKHRAWCGRIFGAMERWGVKDNSVVAWGPRGMADNFSYYEDGNYYDFCLGTDSYLWVG